MTSPLLARARRGTVVVASLATAAIGLSIAPASAVLTGSISGAVTRTGDPALSATLVAHAFEYDELAESYVTVDDSPVVDGTYVLDVPAGAYYYVGVTDTDGHFAPEFYYDALSIQEAQTIYTDAETPSTDNDIEVDPIRLGGTVTDTQGHGIEGVSVKAYSAASGYVDSEFVTTDAHGDYNFAGLADGTYKLEFYYYGESEYVREFYDDATTLEAAAPIVVGSGASVRDKDVVLAKGSSITGTMTLPDGSPAVGGQVWVTTGTQEDPTYVGDATADADGHYTVPGLAAGSYWVDFAYESGETYYSEYWDDAERFEDATPVVVGADGAVTTGISPVMDDHAVTYVGNLARPTVSGAAQVGQTLTADPGTWDRDATYTYYWEGARPGDQMSHSLAEGKTYVPTADTVGMSVWVTVVATATEPGVEAGYEYSDAVGPVTAAPVVTPPVTTPATPPATDVDDSQKPKVQGAKKVGSTLKAKVASWIPAGAVVKYQWLVNGKPIKKATKAKLKVSGKLKGKKVSVQVTATSAGHTPVTVTTKVGKIKKR